MRKVFRLVAVASAATLLLTACGGSDSASKSSSGGSGASTASGDDAKLIAAAKAEGTLTWYSGSSEPSIQKTIDAFTAKYGVKVQYIRLVSGPLATRFDTENKAGATQADVLSSVDDAFFQTELTAGALLPLTSAALPAYAAFPDKYKLGTAAFALGIGPTVIVYNTDIVKTPPKSWQDLLKPEFAGKIILVDPRKSSAWAQMWTSVLNSPKLGDSYITKFAKQGYRQITDTGPAGAQLVAAGEGSILVASTISTPVDLKAQGAPIGYFTLADPAPVYVQYSGIVAKAPHPNAAKLFANWLLSTDGQQTYNTAAGQASALGNLKGTIELPAGVVPIGSAEAAAKLPQLVKLLALS
jgi:iron(III) transport system substrate-binding protein